MLRSLHVRLTRARKGASQLRVFELYIEKQNGLQSHTGYMIQGNHEAAFISRITYTPVPCGGICSDDKSTLVGRRFSRKSRDKNRPMLRLTDLSISEYSDRFLF